jgi:hypothetical protein
MKLRLFLADAAEVREQLLFVLGGGWTEIGPQPQPFALAGIMSQVRILLRLPRISSRFLRAASSWLTRVGHGAP